MAIVSEISGRTAFREYAFIGITPVSRGTWTVRASLGRDRAFRRKEFTGLKNHSAVVTAVIDAQNWLDEQAAR